jgi:hypothetical protein
MPRARDDKRSQSTATRLCLLDALAQPLLSIVRRSHLIACSLICPLAILPSGLGQFGAGMTQTVSTLAELDGTFWRLTDMRDHSDGLSDVIVRITASSVDFSVPCAYFYYPLRDHGSRLTVSPPWAWGGSCMTDKAWLRRPQISRVFDRNIMMVSRYAVNDDRLILQDSHGQFLIALIRLRSEGLENRRWLITSYFDGQTLVAADTTTNSPPQISFMHRHIDGTPGCGAFLGGYVLSGDRLKADVGWTLAGKCTGDWDAVERQNNLIVRALSSAERRIERDGHRVMLRDGQGTIQLMLE